MAVLAIVLGAIFVSHATSKFEAVPTGDMRRLLEVTAGELAYENGGQVPATAAVVLTTRQASQDLVAGGDRVGSDEAVYLVQMVGSFTLNSAPIPSGSEAPEGATLWFLVDSATSQRLDWGIGLRPEDLSTLGEVSSIEPRRPDGAG